MSNKIIWYYERIGHKDVTEAVGIMYIHRRKSIGCSLDNQPIENFITPFVTNMVFQNFGLSWIIQSNQNLNFYFQLHYPSWEINILWYNTMICPILNGSLFEDYVETDKRDRYNLMRSIGDH